MAGMAAAAACGTMAVAPRCLLSSKDSRVGSPLRNVNCTRLVAGKKSHRQSLQVRAFLDIQNDPIAKEALKEPVAFLGGIFAGLLRLDLNEAPLREWVAKTAEAAGVSTEDPEESKSSDGPKEIEIE